MTFSSSSKKIRPFILSIIFWIGVVPLFSYAEEDGNLPEIEARTFGVRVAKESTSKRVYLFDDVSDARPPVGRILLLRRENQNIMGLRVLKVYDAHKQFAAKGVRKYAGIETLNAGESYLAIEKLHDLSGSIEDTPEEAAKDLSDLKEIEDEMDLDAPSDTLGRIIVDEIEPLEPDNWWLSVEFGALRNQTFQEGGFTYFAGGGLKLGVSVFKQVFLFEKDIQDSIALETGFSFYKVLNYQQNSNDSYTVFPVHFTVRYNIFVGPAIVPFVYVGIVQNNVLSQTQGTELGIQRLTNTLPAVGGGLFYRFGPKWFFRADLGIDTFAGGIVLRF